METSKKSRFADIKGMLSRDEMKMIKGGGSGDCEDECKSNSDCSAVPHHPNCASILCEGRYTIFICQ